jgi:hypothetical protein
VPRDPDPTRLLRAAEHQLLCSLCPTVPVRLPLRTMTGVHCEMAGAELLVLYAKQVAERGSCFLDRCACGYERCRRCRVAGVDRHVICVGSHGGLDIHGGSRADEEPVIAIAQSAIFELVGHEEGVNPLSLIAQPRVLDEDFYSAVERIGHAYERFVALKIISACVDYS